MRLPRLAASALALSLCTALAAQAAPRSSSSNAGDMAIAKRVAFRVTDFPAGWSRVPDRGKDTGCFTGPLKTNSPTALMATKRFSSGENGTEAQQFVSIYGAAAGARRALSAVTSSAAFACYKAKFPAIVRPAGLKMESFTGGPLSFDPLVDVVLRAYRYKVSVSKSGQKAALFLDYVFMLRGRVLVASVFVRQSSEPDAYTAHSVLANVVARMPKTRA